jgi:hypothetical protein
MSEKKLESNSIYNQFDADGDGIVTDAEMAQADRLMEMNQKRLEIENQDKREDAQRAMSWFALFGMLLYPASVVVADLLMLDKAPGILGDMAPTYFVSVAAIVAAFYGTQAYSSKK